MKKCWFLLSMLVSLLINVPSEAGTLKNYPGGDWYTRNNIKCDNVVNFCTPVEDNAPYIYRVPLYKCITVASCNADRFLYYKSHEILSHPKYDMIVSYLTQKFSQGINGLPNGRFYKIDKCVKGTGIDGTSCKVLVSYYDKDGNFHTYAVGTISSTQVLNNVPCRGDIKQGLCLQKEANDKDVTPITTGDPISLNGQEVVDGRIDLKFPIEFSRIYHSSNKEYGNLGFGWTTDLEKKVRIPVLSNYSEQVSFSSSTTVGSNGAVSFLPTTLVNTLWVQVQDGTNGDLFFTRTEPTGEWTGAFKNYEGYSLTSTGTEYTLIKPNGDSNKYDATTGLLISEKFKNGTYLNYYYSGNKVSQIVNHFNQYISFTYNGDVISQVSGSNGDYVNYTYTNGYLTQATFNGTETYSYVYDSNGLMIDKYDENNQHYTHYEYDTQNRPIINYMFDKEGNQINRVDLDYSNTSYIAETKQNGNVVRHYFNNYNSGKHLTSSYNKNGDYAITRKAYDINGNLTKDTNSLGSYIEYTYDSNNLVTTVKKENGAVINNTYDSITRLLSSMNEQTSNGNRITTYTYDNYHNVSTKTIQGNNETLNYTYGYSNDGRLLTKNEPNGLGYTYAYYDIDGSSNSGLVQSITTSTGKVITVNSYDTRGNATSITGIDGRTKNMTYDIRGRLLSETVNGATNNYSYDQAGNLITSSFASGYELTMTYDPAHRLTKIEDNMGGSEEFVLDSTTGKPVNTNTYQNSILVRTMNQVLNNVGDTIKTYNSDSTKAYNYSALFNDSSVSRGTDPQGTNITRYTYNTGLVESINYAGDINAYTYDYDNNVKTIKANNQLTTYTYDDFGRLTQLISPDTGTQNITYNTANNIKTRIDANNVSHKTTTDIEGKVINIMHTGAGSTLNENYEYNNLSRLKKVSDNSGSTEFEYDTYGYLNKKTQNINGINFNIDYENNNLGQLVSVTYPSGMVVNYTYDKGYLTDIDVGNNNIIKNVTYNSLQKQPVSWKLGNNLVSITRNTDGAITNFIDDGVINQSLTIDNMLNIKAINDSANSRQNVTANFTTNYSITSFTSSLGIQTHGNTNNFNISSITGNGENSSWTYVSGNNKINAFTKMPNVAYLYDLNGNVKVDNKGTYTYDLKNNLITSNRNQDSGSYLFNAFNQRVAKNVSGQLRYFVYNESNQLIGEYDSSGNVINEYIYFGLRPVAVNNSGNINIVHTDYLSTPRYVTDSANNLLWKWENLDPYGSNLPEGNLEFNLRFAGQYYDSESGLHYNMFRTYDPSSKRYMQSDPLGLAAGNNTYNYVGRNPLNYVDPLGLTKDQIEVNIALMDTRLGLRGFAENYHFNNNTFYIFAEGFEVGDRGAFGISSNYSRLDEIKDYLAKQTSKNDNGEYYLNKGETFAKIIKQLYPQIKKYKKIVLLVCNSGRLKDVSPKQNVTSMAQNFAINFDAITYASMYYMQFIEHTSWFLTTGWTYGFSDTHKGPLKSGVDMVPFNNLRK